MVIGCAVARLLAKNIKKQIYGLEPEKTTHLLNEREVLCIVLQMD